MITGTESIASGQALRSGTHPLHEIGRFQIIWVLSLRYIDRLILPGLKD